MSVLSRARVLMCACAIVALGALVFSPAAGARKIGSEYLALGDSLAYGFQTAQFEEEIARGEGVCLPPGFPHDCIKPASFDHGYVDDFVAALKLFHPGLQVINDGCPGETTETMINGPGSFTHFACAGGPDEEPFPFIWLHHEYAFSQNGSQLSDALSILEANPNAVSPITLDIGGNDLTDFLKLKCGFPGPLTCEEAQVLAEVGTIQKNVEYILEKLRKAAPKAQIVLLGLYNAYPLVLTPEGSGDKLVAAFNSAQASAAAKFGASFANPEPLFNPSLITGKPEGSDLRTICAFTAMCPGGTFDPVHGDYHPTNLGYGVLAGVVGFTFITR